MTIADLLKKYKKYYIEYLVPTQTLKIFKSIPVEDFLTIKYYIKKYKLKVSNIIVETWR